MTEGERTYGQFEYYCYCPTCKEMIVRSDKIDKLFCNRCGGEMLIEEKWLEGTNPLKDRELERKEQEVAEQESEIPEGAIILEVKQDSKPQTIVFEGKKVESDKAFYEDIEETAQLPKGFVCAINRKGIKLYFKLGAKLKEGTELIPLSKSELREVGIEESVIETYEKYIKSIFKNIDLEVEE